MSRQHSIGGGRNDQDGEQIDEGRKQRAVVPANAENEELPTNGHEDLAWFTRTAAELAALEAEARARADERGPHGRRFARLRTVIEDALLQARQGVHEARHGQYESAERSRQ